MTETLCGYVKSTVAQRRVNHTETDRTTPPALAPRHFRYTGGKQDGATYQTIGDHYEGLLVRFDPAVVTYKELLTKFFAEHQPSARPSTRRNQYNNGLWYTGDAQCAEIAKYVAANFDDPASQVLTPIESISSTVGFYKAEDYHQHYFARRGGGGSCPIR